MTYQAIDTLITTKMDRLNIGSTTPTEDSWIEEVEELIDIKLPESYKWFVKKYSTVILDGEYLKTISPTKHREVTDIDISYLYLLDTRKKNTPINHLTILKHSEGTYYFLVDESKEDAEYEIYHSEPWNDEDELFANTFLEFLAIKLKQIH